MHIIRCKDQTGTLEDFFTGKQLGGVTVGGEVMLGLISQLRALPSAREVYGLTSLHRLCFLAEDTQQSPWYVIVAAFDPGNYFIESLVPQHSAPWPVAYMKGVAHSEDEAVEMIGDHCNKTLPDTPGSVIFVVRRIGGLVSFEASPVD